MIKRDIVETIYEYDKDGSLKSKTVTETHEEDDETRYPYYTYPITTLPIKTMPCTCEVTTKYL